MANTQNVARHSRRSRDPAGPRVVSSGALRPASSSLAKWGARQRRARYVSGFGDMILCRRSAQHSLRYARGTLRTPNARIDKGEFVA
jgi:hypothetical protein